jgi:uncharacterized protein
MNMTDTHKMQIEHVLKKAFVCRLALSVDHSPYLVPVCFGYDHDRIYFHSGPGGKKIHMLASNPRVCFELETDVEVIPSSSPCRFSMRYRCVIGEGVAHRLVDEQEKRIGLDAIIRQYGGEPGKYTAEALAEVEVYAIAISHLSYKQHHIKGEG